MALNILSRVGSGSSASNSSLQFQVDGLVGRFVEESTDLKTLSSLTAGGLAYRFGRLGLLGSKWIGVAAGLGAEVSTFEFTQRGLSSVSVGAHGPAPLHANLWSWNGAGGIRQGLLQSFITFGTLKGAGHLVRGENFLIQHLLQDSALVTGQRILGAMGVSPRHSGTLAEQFLHAEALNLQLGAGLSLGHSFLGGRLSNLERGLDLSFRFPSLRLPQSFLPKNFAMAMANNGGMLESAGVPDPIMANRNLNGGGGSEAHFLVLKMTDGLHVRPSTLVAELLHYYPEVRLTLQRVGSTEEPVAVNPLSIFDLLELGVATGEEIEWRAEGPQSEELLAGLRYHNDNHWGGRSRGSKEAIEIRRISVGKASRIAVAVSHAMDELKAETLSGVYHRASDTLTVAKTDFEHAAIARKAELSPLAVTRVVFERMGSLVKMIFPPDDSHLEELGGNGYLKGTYPALFEGIDLKRERHRLTPVDRVEDIPIPYLRTPAGRLLEYHNLNRPFGHYLKASCLVGMCVDHPKMLRLPDQFAFVLRSAANNFQGSDFDLSMALSLANLSTFALIGHTHCPAVDLALRKQAYVEGLVRNGGWEKGAAEAYFDENAPKLQMENEIDFLLKESARLRKRYPNLLVVPLLYRVEDGRLYLLREDKLPPR